ncbi:MAG: nuclear transport factor 2 family protein [Saprospiraceae bacterium]|nr:nuclear transport factor 2 family protein [Saprospiraceae bacterium]
MKSRIYLFLMVLLPAFSFAQIKINSPYKQKQEQKDGSYIPDANENKSTGIPATGDASYDDNAIAGIVQQLFTAMNQSDGNKIKSLFAPEGRLTSTDEKGQINTTTVDQFSQMISKAVKGSLEERVTSMDINIDDNLATVWAEYDFYYNRQLQHCGVDAFQLFKGSSGWKIVQISDTRRTNCMAGGKSAMINQLLDGWHAAASSADGQKYFDLISADGIYLGTDASENWNKENFIKFAKPYFDKGNAWNFTPKDRNIYFSDDQQIAWFNELLDTWMGECRGTGVLKKQSDGQWKLMQYNLAILVPNDLVQDYLKLVKSKN